MKLAIFISWSFLKQCEGLSAVAITRNNLVFLKKSKTDSDAVNIGSSSVFWILLKC